MFVCLLVCGNPSCWTDLDEILHMLPQLSKEGFGPDLTPAPSPPVPGLPKILKAEGDIFEHSLKNKICSEGCKLTWAAPDTSAIK